MDRYREKSSAFFTRLTDGLGRKWRPATVPLSEPPGSPAPQTSLIFELPDELILYILSHISSDPYDTGQYARFRLQYRMGINDCHQQRLRFLLPLSMTCRAMRLRLLSWVWERIEYLEPPPLWGSEPIRSRKRNTITGALRADMSLAAIVRFVMVLGIWNHFDFPAFVECLGSLPNLHTLEIARAHNGITTPLRNALKRVQLPQIKTLTIPPNAHPLLRHCHNVEDVVYVVGGEIIPSDKFLESLASNMDSKVKRLAIPLVLWGDPSLFAAACPKLTELTLIFRHPHDIPFTERGIQFDPDKSARSATLDLVNACKALPDFDTLQIVRFIPTAPSPDYADAWTMSLSPMRRWEWNLRERLKGVRDLAIDCLRKQKNGCKEGEGRKTTLRVIELIPYFSVSASHLDSVVVEEYEV